MPSNDRTGFKTGDTPIEFDRWCREQPASAWHYSFLDSVSSDPCWATYDSGYVPSPPAICKSLTTFNTCITTFPGGMGMGFARGPVWRHLNASAV